MKFLSKYWIWILIVAIVAVVVWLNWDNIFGSDTPPAPAPAQPGTTIPASGSTAGGTAPATGTGSGTAPVTPATGGSVYTTPVWMTDLGLTNFSF